MNFLVTTLSTFFCVGYLPLIPGTFGSIAGLFLCYLSRHNQLSYLLSALLVTAVGFLVSGRTEKLLQKKDPSCVVIDEVSGMLLSLLFIPFKLQYVLFGFFLFRLLDTLKPYPAGGFQNLHGSLGIMSDDIVAAFYTNMILQLVVSFASFKAS